MRDRRVKRTEACLGAGHRHNRGRVDDFHLQPLRFSVPFVAAVKPDFGGLDVDLRQPLCPGWCATKMARLRLKGTINYSTRYFRLPPFLA
jgi:hypothetical protein